MDRNTVTKNGFYSEAIHSERYMAKWCKQS